METNDVHIWQLPEKTDDVNKDTDVILIYSGEAKKVLLNKMSEHYNQDYKADNFVEHFENNLDELDQEYELQYALLEALLDEYQITVNDFIEKFTDNRDIIRRLETESIQLDNSLIGFDTLKKEHDTLLTAIRSLAGDVANLRESSVQNVTNTNKVSNNIEDLEEQKDYFAGEYTSINTNADEIRKTIIRNSNNKNDILLESINAKHDKILEIIQYYHHIT